MQRFREPFLFAFSSLAFVLLGLFILAPTRSIAGDVTVLSIGPRYGFSRTTITGWNNLVLLDPGVGLAFLSRQEYGIQDFGGRLSNSL